MPGAFDLATVGDNCIDRYLPPVGLSTVGGNAVNVAVHLSAMGHRVAYYGAVGNDDDGRRTVAALRGKGVATGRVRADPRGRTAITDIRSGPGGARTIAFEDFGVCRGYRPDAAEVAELLRKRHVHIGWLDDGGDLRRALARGGAGVSQDLSVNTDPHHAVAEGLGIAFAAAASWSEAEALLARTLAAGARVAVVTCGAAGSMASDGRVSARAGVAPVEAIDTLGAGDTFIAAFLDRHVRGADLQACLEAGRDAAAVTCAHFGGFRQEAVAFADEPR